MKPTWTTLATGLALLLVGGALALWGPAKFHDVALMLIGSAIPTKLGALRKPEAPQ